MSAARGHHGRGPEEVYVSNATEALHLLCMTVWPKVQARLLEMLRLRLEAKLEKVGLEWDDVHETLLLITSTDRLLNAVENIPRGFCSRWRTRRRRL